MATAEGAAGAAGGWAQLGPAVEGGAPGLQRTGRKRGLGGPLGRLVLAGVGLGAGSQVPSEGPGPGLPAGWPALEAGAALLTLASEFISTPGNFASHRASEWIREEGKPRHLA